MLPDRNPSVHSDKGLKNAGSVLQAVGGVFFFVEFVLELPSVRKCVRYLDGRNNLASTMYLHLACLRAVSARAFSVALWMSLSSNLVASIT